MVEGDGTRSVPTVRVAQVASVYLLRLREPSAKALSRLGKALGGPLPVDPNRSSGTVTRVCWRAPGEWMVVNGPVEANVLAEAIEDDLGHVVEVTAGTVGFVLEGAQARDLLLKGCSLDLHRRAFAPDTCARTLFAQAHVLIDRVGDGDRFDLYGDASLAHHLQRWFDDALLEFKL